MSDQPNNKKPDEPEKSSGWHTPQTGGRTPQEAAPSGWRAPDEPKPSGEDWRVPTLPRDLDVTPENRGAWHLPEPKDTSLTPEDESVIEAGQPPPAEAAAPETPAEAEVIPFEETQTDMQAPTLEPMEEEGEDDTFSMSELVALASLVDNVPSVEVRPAPPPATEQPQTTQADTMAGASDTALPVIEPGEYARQQLERLRKKRAAEEPVAPAPKPAAPAQEPAAPTQEPAAPAQEQPAATDQAAEYARQQLERLGAQPSAAQAPAEAQPAAALPPEQQALADKFTAAENNIRALRQQYQQGAITRDQFQADLRSQMVLDNNNIWWMMGVESDRWYRHENDQWVPATPPNRAAGAPASPFTAEPTAQPVTTDTGGEGDRTVPTSAVSGDWVPRPVPVTDPDSTVPGTGAIYMDTRLTPDTVPSATFDDQATVPSSAYTGETVPSQAVGGQYESVSSPYAAPAAQQPAAQQPAYNIAEAAPGSTYEQAVATQRQNTARTIAIVAAIIAALTLVVAALGVIGIVVYYNSLASPWRSAIDGLANYQPQFRTARILAADGSLIAELTSPKGGARDVVSLNQIAPEMVHAVVSVENERFFEDPGFDPIAIVRAFLQNLTSGQVESGASTITQQIARNLILQDTTVSPSRKLQEIVVAAEIARKYDKNFILQLYLNEVFFGNQSYGVEAASQFYFHHSANGLNLPEAAMLAGLIQAPAKYDPVINRNEAFARMNDVLKQQVAVGCLQFSFAPYDKQPFCINQSMISGPQFAQQKAVVETNPYQPRTFQVKYPHFVNFIQQQIENDFGTSEMFRRGFEITTTLIPRVQDVAQTALQAQVKSLANNGINTGAVMVTDPHTGAIRAMIGSPDFNDDANAGQVNNAFTWQQPGSSIKPVEYIGALEGVDRADGTHDYLTPASILWDVPTSFTNPDYTPVNYDRRFHGPVAVRFALANSYNVPAVKVLNFIGLNKFVDVANRLGLKFLPENPPQNAGLAAALGANEVRLYDMMQMYGTIANNGQRVPLYGITNIKDAGGADVALPDRPQPAQAIQPQIAFLIQNILSDNDARTPAFGANSPLVVNGYQGRVAAKTGTSSDNRDLWTMGFSSNAVVGVWIGRVDNNPTVNTSGLAAAPIWNAAMTAALQGTNPTPFNPPQGIMQQQICADTGTLYDQSTSCTTVRTEYFLSNQPPPSAGQGFVQTVGIDTWTGLKANQFCTESVVSQAFVNISDPSAIAWLNTPNGTAYAKSIGLPTPVQQVPQGECSPSTVLPQVRITGPTEGQQVLGPVTITGIATGPNFSRYQIELAPVTSPNNFQVVAGPFQNQGNGTLATWDSTTQSNGAYIMRLAAFAADGGYRYNTVSIGVNNPPPTPTPAPTIVSTTINETPIPFPTPTIFQGG